MSLLPVVVLAGTSHAATLAYRFAFANVGVRGDVGGSVSFTEPSPLELLTVLAVLPRARSPSKPSGCWSVEGSEDSDCGRQL